MEDMREPTAPRQHGRRRLRLWGIVLSLALILGVGAFLGSTLGASRAQAAPGSSGAAAQLTPTETPGTPGTTGTPGPCGGEVTVSHVNNRVITVTRSDGTTANIYVSSHTHYTENGHTVSVSAIKAGSKVYVVGTCKNQGRTINATSIEVVRGQSSR